ncbi:interleukin-1 receptor type 1-like, partial [Clarias magur]
ESLSLTKGVCVGYDVEYAGVICLDWSNVFEQEQECKELQECRMELRTSDSEKRRLKERVESLESSLQEALGAEQSCSAELRQVKLTLEKQEEELRQVKSRQLDTTHDLEKTRDLCFKLGTGKEAVQQELESCRSELELLRKQLALEREKDLNRQLSSQERLVEIQLLRDKLAVADSKASTQNREMAQLRTRSALLEADVEAIRRQLNTERDESLADIVMEFTPGEVSGNTEDATGRKKSRFKFFKARLFGRLKKKETEGRMKQSQSTGDVTAQEGGRGEDDSEDDCQYPKGELSSRALSHDSIFLADQVQSSQPTRVLSQENVHTKIKALQLKLQQQNIRLAPPLLIPGKRMEDPGATSEDDGLPRSPPEISFQEVAMQSRGSKYPEAKSHLSWLSLAGTGSEEEEQGGFSQPSSRPLSPAPQLPPAELPSAVVDFTSPAQYVPLLDNSAARHRMSIKPRNKRASTKATKKPNLYRPRTSSTNSLDQPLSETEEKEQSVTPTQIMHRYSYASEDLTHAEEPVSFPSSAHSREEQEKFTRLDGRPWSPLINEATEDFQQEDKTNTSSLVSSDEVKALHCSYHTRDSLAEEPIYDNHYTNKINVYDEHRASSPLKTLSICPGDIAFEYSVIKERTDDSLETGSTDQMESVNATVNVDVSKPPEAITRPLPVPAPRIKKPTLLNLNSVPPKVSTVKPIDPEKEPGTPSPRDDKPLRPSSFRFNIASAKHRSKTSDENVARQDEESSGNTPKGQTYNHSPVVHMEKAENTKSTEVCRNSPSAPDIRGSLWRDAMYQNASNTGVGDNPEKSENTEDLKSEIAEESEDRRGLFGVKLRSTSLCLKYRSELPRPEAEIKRHSLEGHLIVAAKDKVSSDTEAVINDRKSSAMTNPASQSLDSQQDPTLYKDSQTDSRPEPAWRSLAREKAKVQSTKPPTQPVIPQNSASLSTPPQSSSTQQPSKPPLQPRPHLAPTSKPQTANQTSQQMPPKAAPRATEKWPMSNQREEKSTVSQSSPRDDSMDFKRYSKPGYPLSNSANTTFSMDSQVLVSVEAGPCPSIQDIELTQEGTNITLNCSEDLIPVLGQRLQVEWGKDCEPANVRGSEFTLLNVNMNNSGNYTCLVIFRYEDKNYTASHTFQLIVLQKEPSQEPRVIKPRNETRHVKPGVEIELECNVFIGFGDESKLETSVYWLINESFAETHEELRQTLTTQKTKDSKMFGNSKLIISKVLPEFFGVPFTCVILNPMGMDTGKVWLSQADNKNYTLLITVVLIILTVVAGAVLLSFFKIDLILAYRHVRCKDKASQETKLYDAYVLYLHAKSAGSSTAQDLVLRTLPEILEKRHNLRLFIHGRDTDTE